MRSFHRKTMFSGFGGAVIWVCFEKQTHMISGRKTGPPPWTFPCNPCNPWMISGVPQSVDSFRVCQIGPQTMFGPVAGGPLQRPDDDSIHGGKDIENIPLCQEKFACVFPGDAPACERSRPALFCETLQAHRSLDSTPSELMCFVCRCPGVGRCLSANPGLSDSIPSGLPARCDGCAFAQIVTTAEPRAGNLHSARQGGYLGDENGNIKSHGHGDPCEAPCRRARQNGTGLVAQPAHFLFRGLLRPGPHGLPLIARHQ